ncbi:MAG: N-acetylmuramoyl-L-alanine amidase [Endomicrobia bacterium]|nr:N-acetylmuramoyl-L-alanine amidase [Endomicrobiia bacterium]
MKNCHKLLFLLIMGLSPFVSSSTSSFRIEFYTTIQVVVNAEKIYELPVYKVLDRQQKYITVKDLAKIFKATLNYYSAGKYVGFNCRGEKIYFYINRDYFIWSKERFKLLSDILNINNRVLVPIDLLTNKSFTDILNIETEYRKDNNILIVNWSDTIVLSYYVALDKATVEIKTSKIAKYEYTYEDNKIILTFPGEKIHPKEYKITGSIIESIKQYQQNGDVVIFIYCKGFVEIKKEEYNGKIVLEIYKQQEISLEQNNILSKNITSQNDSSLKQSDKEEYKNEINEVKEKELVNMPPVVVNNAIKNQKKFTIVIDPGHGGEDPGAVGKYGTKEKDINLAVALLLKEKLENDGFNILLTRDKDIFIPLVKRTKFANDNKADLFISIHCNASEKPSGTDKGFEVYFLSETATDPDAVATEKLENEVIRYEKQTEELTKLQKLLWSMIVNEFINESSKLCSLISNDVISRTKQNFRGVKQAGFYVLRGAQMPAVLVEIGFISNTTEELMLIRKDFQQLISDGIYSSIRKYYEESKR